MLASRAELDSFTKVKQAIDKMIGALKQEQADEVKKVDYCKSSLQENEMSAAKTSDHKDDLLVKLDGVNTAIANRHAAMSAANAEHSDVQVRLQTATENRKSENLDFQKSMADQKAIEAALKDALHRLSIFYDKQSFLQTGQREKQAPPMPQKTYTPHEGSTGVMELIGKIIQDTKSLQDETLADEQLAQEQYEKLVVDTQKECLALEREMATISKQLGAATKEKLELEGDIDDTDAELESLSRSKADFHKECDWMVEHFDSRQQARGAEIEALQQAKQILNGADMV